MDLDTQFLAEELAAPVLGMGRDGPSLGDDLTAARAAEMATDPETAHALAVAASRPPRRDMVDRLLAGDFPAWVRPVSRSRRAPPGKREGQRELERADAMADAGRMSYEALHRRVEDIEARLLDADSDEDDENATFAPPGVDVRLADGTLFRCATGDRVPVHAVEFLFMAPKPPPRKPGAQLTRKALVAALPSRESVVAAAVAAAAADGPEQAEATLENHAVAPNDAEREALAAGLARWKPRQEAVRRAGGVTEVTAGQDKASDAGLARDAPEALGCPDGPLKLDLGDAVEHPATALRQFKRWLASATREAPRPALGSRAPIKEEAAPTGRLGTLFEPFEVVRAHASEYEGAADAGPAFDDAPDFLTRAPDRGDVEAEREDALEREYRERSRDADAKRWPTHLAAIRDGATHLPPFALDVVSIATVAERVLAIKAARFVRVRPDTSPADVDGVKAKQAGVHALAALAAFAELAGVSGAAGRLEPLVGSEHAVGKAFVDTLDLVPEMRRPQQPSPRSPRSPRSPMSLKQPVQSQTHTKGPTKVPTNSQRALAPLVRWWWTAVKPVKKARKEEAHAQHAQHSQHAPHSQQAQVVLLPAPADEGTIHHVEAVENSHAPSVTAAILRARKAGDLAELLAQQDGAFLDHLARHRLPMMMPDPDLRDLLLADAAARPPVTQLTRFDQAAAQKAGAFLVARAMALPRVAMQLGGADLTLGAVSTAFARAHSLPAPKATPSSEATFPAPKLRPTEYDRFEETELLPWLGRALRANAPKTAQLKTSIGDIRRKDRERRDAALDALEPERYQAVMELRRVGAFDEAAFERLVLEQEAAAQAEATDDKDDDDKDDAGAAAEEGSEGYSMGGEDGDAGVDEK